MRARQLTPHIVQLPRLHFVNAFLVREDDGFTLVDTTLPRGADALLATANGGARIRRIALTHGHGDRAPGRRCTRSPTSFSGRATASAASRSSKRHTPGHVAFLDVRDRSLIAGDVFTTYGGAAVTSHFTFPFPLAAMATWDKELNLGSARSLRALEPTQLAVGHGPALSDPEPATRRAIERAHRALC